MLGALAAVPVALTVALRSPVSPGAHLAVVALVCLAVLAWCGVLAGLGRLVAAHLAGRSSGESGLLAWAAVRVAALILVIAPFLDASGQAAQPRGHGTAEPGPRPPSVSLRVDDGTIGGGGGHAARTRPRGGHRGATGHVVDVSLGTGAILVPLAADLRRRARARRRLVLDDDRAVDVETALLAASASPASLLRAVARSLEAAGRLGGTAHVVLADGEVWSDDGTWTYDPAAAAREVRCLVLVLGDDVAGTHVVFVPRGATIAVGGTDARSLLADAVRVSGAVGLGRVVLSTPDDLLRALAVRDDDELVASDGSVPADSVELRGHVVEVTTGDATPDVEVGPRGVVLRDGRLLDRSALSPAVRALLDGTHDVALGPTRDDAPPDADDDDAAVDDRGVVVRLLAAVPRVDGLVAPLEVARERRAVELLAYLALRDGQPVTGDRLRVRVLGGAGVDAAAKTLFNVASSLRRSLGDGVFGPRLPAAGRLGRYAVAPDVLCDVTVLEARVARGRRSAVAEERMAWLRAALELVESEPFATVLEGYDWFLAEGHLSRLQAVCEDAACELVDLALERGLRALAAFAVERARLVDQYSERLSDAAARVAAARQASFEAIAPAARSTEPSAPAVT